MKIQLQFESPLLIGGKKHSSNFIETDDVIKGDIIRAAFAKIILDRCSAKNEKDFEGKKNWVFFRDCKICEECKFRKVCNKFSDIKFSYFYPKNTEIIPLSAKACKNDDKHGIYDDLITKESTCKCGNRLEFKSGLRLKDTKQSYMVKKEFLMKNGINQFTKTSSDGLLYSIETVVSTSTDYNNSELIYEGYIENMDIDDLSLFNVLRVGGDTTVGLGKCKIILIEEENVITNYKDIEKKLDFFNREYKHKKNKYQKSENEDKNNYLAVKLIGDAILNFNNDGSYKTTEELKEIWENALEINGNIHVDKVYAEIENYRGYDNSLNTDSKREKAKCYVKKGTVIVFSTEADIKELYEAIKNRKNFGEEEINGFGQYELYLGGL